MKGATVLILMRKMLGIFLIFFALIGIMISAMGFIDPEGAKLADDNDPYGTPPSRLSILISHGFSYGVGILGIILVFYRKKRD